MRVTGDHVHRPYLVWQAGIMDRVPACIDHAVLAMEIQGIGDDAELSILMRDVAPDLVTAGGAAIAEIQHARFVDHLAELAVAFWAGETPSGASPQWTNAFDFSMPQAWLCAGILPSTRPDCPRVRSQPSRGSAPLSTVVASIQIGCSDLTLAAA
jgi:hypothetical protein